jgi:hypothetical protein
MGAGRRADRRHEEASANIGASHSRGLTAEGAGTLNADLDAARAALDRGDTNRALGHAWRGAVRSITRNDRGGIGEAIKLAGQIQERSQGGTAQDASRLVQYVTYARDHPQATQIGGATLRERHWPGRRR